MITLTRHAGTSSNGRRTNGLDDRYHALFSRVTFGNNGSPPVQSVGVISCSRGEGSSTVAANLAVWAAGVDDEPVALVDAGGGTPAFHRSFGVEPSPGLAEVLSDRSDLAASLQRSSVENLSIITPGKHRGGGFVQCRPAKLSGVLDALRQGFALVVFDLPAATEPWSDLRLTGALDGVLLVVEAGRTPIPVAQRVKKELLRGHANLLGVVLNKQAANGAG